MSDERVELPVVLTAEEASDVSRKAAEQGIDTGDFLGYCVRVLSFGIVYAVRMLPKPGQVGTDSSDTGG